MIERGNGEYCEGMGVISKELLDKINNHEIPLAISRFDPETGRTETTEEEAGEDDEKPTTQS